MVENNNNISYAQPRGNQKNTSSVTNTKYRTGNVTLKLAFEQLAYPFGKIKISLTQWTVFSFSYILQPLLFTEWAATCISCSPP